jgi:hypothetical protein
MNLLGLLQERCLGSVIKTTLTFGAPGRGFRCSRCFSSMTMVDIHSMAASAHPSRHEREAKGGATSHPRAGRSRCSSSRLGATTVIVESQPQRTAGMAAPPPVAAGTDATLQVACQLLNNPPPSGASPSVVEQWRHDVDQLMVATINMPPHERRCARHR